jgi:signal transduction histidine kinase
MDHNALHNRGGSVFEIGTSLRQAREQRGLRLAEVETRTHIRSRYLQALEDERFDLLPGEAYVKGFLRTYAEALGLDANLYVAEYTERYAHEDELPLAPRPVARVRRPRRFPYAAISVAALVALALCLVVLLVGRAVRDRRLRAAEQSLAESRLRTAWAETAATRAELAAVQARLNPHFLSNALHSVSALVATDPEAAEESLDRLGDLFRYTLEQSERRVVRLEDEWQFVKDYLAIEQMRLGDRLAVEMTLDPAAAACAVPSFALQPLVENAIRHGIGPRRDGGTVRVSARRDDGRVELLVSDDGLGADPSVVDASGGTGLRTLRQRLALDDTLDGRVEVETAPGAGFRVRVSVAADGL